MDIVYNYFVTNKVHLIDTTELLRAEIVMLISALDHYVHQVVKEAVVDIFSRNNNTKNLERLSIPLDKILILFSIEKEDERLRFLGHVVQDVISKDSYQSVKGIEFALGAIKVDKIWSKLSTLFSMESDEIKKRLGVIVHRRNKIAHESDIDPTTYLKRSISQVEVHDNIEFIEKLVFYLDTLIEASYEI